MAANPLITFKAGRCESSGPGKVKPLPTPGYLYLYSEDDLIHLCWRPRSVPATSPETDLITIPGDATFTPLVKEPGAEDVRSPTNGRVFVLKFSSSGEKHYFWMQAKTQHRAGDLSWFSQRDQRLGQIVDALLSGEEVNVEAEVEDIRRNQVGSGGGGEGGDDEDLMELDRQESQTGGAGADATGGDPREEGQSSREGGADGGRAPQDQSQNQDTSALVQNFLQSLNSGSGQQQQQQAQTPSTTLPDLLPTSTTVPWLSTLSAPQTDNLCSFVPPELFLLSQESSSDPSSSDPNPSPAAAQAAIEALSMEQKKDILRKVLRSPQLQQSLGSLTVALRDGGLPMIADALGLKVSGGANPVEAFVEGYRRMGEEEEEKEGK